MICNDHFRPPNVNFSTFFSASPKFVSLPSQKRNQFFTLPIQIKCCLNYSNRMPCSLKICEFLLFALYLRNGYTCLCQKIINRSNRLKSMFSKSWKKIKHIIHTHSSPFIVFWIIQIGWNPCSRNRGKKIKHILHTHTHHFS